MDHGSMPMWFTFNMYPYTVLFEEWKITEEGALIGSCFGVMFLAIIYEVTKSLRKLWERNVLHKLQNDCMASKSSSYQQMRKLPKFWMHHTAQSVLHTIQFFLGYSLMLIVMTFNVWLLVSTVVGAGVGYLCGEGVLNRSDYRNQSREEIPLPYQGKAQENRFDSDGTSFSSSASDCKKHSF